MLFVTVVREKMVQNKESELSQGNQREKLSTAEWFYFLGKVTNALA